jgi:hypothetical protein
MLGARYTLDMGQPITLIPEGSRFIIDEYDGSESITFLDSIDYLIA